MTELTSEYVNFVNKLNLDMQNFKTFELSNFCNIGHFFSLRKQRNEHKKNSV